MINLGGPQLLDLAKYIREVPDFPKPGILFRDITPLLLEPAAIRQVIHRFKSACLENGVDTIVGIESRGFIFAAPLAMELGLPFIPIRKPGKLPAEKMTIEYALEYGEGQLDIHKDSIKPGAKVAIVDDLLATGGTAKAAAQLVELLNGKVQLFLFLVELSQLGGAKTLENFERLSLLNY